MRKRLVKAVCIVGVCAVCFSLGALAALGDGVVVIGGKTYYREDFHVCVPTKCASQGGCVSGSCPMDINHGNQQWCSVNPNNDNTQWYWCTTDAIQSCYLYWPVQGYACTGYCTANVNTACTCGWNMCAM